MGGKNNNTRYRWHGKTVSLILSAALLATSFTGLGSIAGSAEAAEESSPVDYGLMDTCQKGTILHCFDWKYTDIIEELPNIAAAGFTSVQTSPAQPGADLDNNIWYYLYQPLGFYIGANDLGTQEELQELCTEAHKYGIKVIVDVVANHLAGDHTYIDQELKKDMYWRTSDEWTTNATTRKTTIYEPIVDKYDIKSENQNVQDMVRDYVQQLKGVGVDGIRWDAVKHIPIDSDGCDFFANVIDNTMYNYGEILQNPGGNSSDHNNSLMQEYANYMSITDDVYGNDLRNSLKAGTIPSTAGNWSYKGMSTDKLIYWAESHDTYANTPTEQGANYSAIISQNIIDRTYAIAASRAGATALYFSRPEYRFKTDIKAGSKGSTHFTSAEVAAVNHFHNAMYGQTDYYVTKSVGQDNNYSAAAVLRQEGAVIVTGKGGGYEVNVKNGSGSTLPAGTYIDEITGNTWNVTTGDNGRIIGNIGNNGIAVIYQQSKYPNLEILGESPSTASSGKLKLYFDNQKFGWSNVYAYVYDETKITVTNGTDNNAEWPGQKMTLNSETGLYELEVDGKFKGVGMVLFNNGESGSAKKQYPDSIGMELADDQMILYQAEVNEKFEKVWDKYPAPSQSESGSVSAYPSGGEFYGNTLDLTLNVSGNIVGTPIYMTSDGGYGSFADGDTVTVGEATENDSTLKVNIKATLRDNSVISQTYTYTKHAPVIEEGSVSASVADGTTFTDTLEVTLYAQNVDSTTYKINDGDEIFYSDGDTVLLDDTATITMTGVQSDGTTVTATYTYTKEQETDTVKVYFDNSGYNWSNVYAYVYQDTYDSNTGNTNMIKQQGTWPGTKLTKQDSNGLYVLDVDGYESVGRVIFNDGTSSKTNRYPYDGDTGIKIGDSSMYFTYGHGWDYYNPNVYTTSDTGTTFTDKAFITLHAKAGISDLTYTTSDGQSGTFTDGSGITIGEYTLAGDSVTVTLSGKDSEGYTVQATYTYQKILKIYFNNAKSWDKVYAYVYGGAGEIDHWPGKLATYNSTTGLYEYDVTGDFVNNGKVRFSNGSTDNKTDKFAITGKSIKVSISNGKWLSEEYPQDISEGVITLSASELDYTGENQTVTATVTVGETTLTQGTDYTIEGDTSGTNAGTYIVKAIGKGGYKGTLKATWKIKQSYTVTVDMNGTTTTHSNLTNGQSFSVKADKVDGETFSCWKVGEKVVSTSEAYSFIVLGDTTLTAVYDEAVEAKPILNMSAVQATYNGKNAVKFIFTHSVPSGYTVKEVGIRYGTNKLAGANTSINGYATVDLVERGSEYGVSNVESVVKNKSFKIKQYVANYKCLNGTVQFYYAVGANTTAYVYAVGYMKLVKDGVEQIVYSDFIHTSYNGIS